MRIIVYPHAMSIGGSQLNAIELAAAVRDRGHEVTIFASETGVLADTVARLGLPLVVAPSHRRRPSFTIAAALREICRRQHIDIVHGYEWPPSLEAFYGPLLFDRVVVGCTVMSMAVAPFLPPSIPLIVGTEQIAAAARVGRAGPVRVIEPPVDTRSNHPDVDGGSFRAAYRLGSRPTVVLVSRLAAALKREGVERTIAAVGLLAAELDLRLVIVGDGPAREGLERAAMAVNARSSEATVTLTGELADPRAAYAAADVVLGMGGSALRAMAFAKPVIVLGERGFAQLLTPESAGLFLWQGLYGLGDGNTQPGILAGLLRTLLNDPERRGQLGVFAREFVVSHFDLLRAGERQEQLYVEWLGKPPVRSTAIGEAFATGSQVLARKVSQRLHRWLGRHESEDFNSIAEITKTASQAGPPRD